MEKVLLEQHLTRITMRRAFVFTAAILEIGVATALVVFGVLVGSADIEGGFGKAEQVTRAASAQIRMMRDQVRELRRPELRYLADRLQIQMHLATAVLEDQRVDFETVRSMADALGDVGSALDHLERGLREDPLGKLGKGLSETATFLEKIIPVAAKAANDLDATTEALGADARRLDALLRNAPLDLKAAREIHASLAHFGEGLDRMGKLLQSQRLEALRDGFDGMESALTTGAGQVERLSQYSYPAVVFKGLKPEVTQRPFWPEGDEIAKGLRKAAAGVTAAGKEINNLDEDLPRLRASLEASRKVVERLREALGTALRQHENLEALLKDLPVKAAQLADNLPRVGKDLSRMLRDTVRLGEVAQALRQGQHGLDDVALHWPELRRTLNRSATLLQGARKQLQHVLVNREQYEAAQREGAQLGQSLAALLPLLTEHLQGQLQDQDQSLDDLRQSIDQVGSVLPAYGSATARLLRAAQLLAWLMAAITGLHGSYLLVSGWTTRCTARAPRGHIFRESTPAPK
jgi:ABC-type transporter Mla subunit MlaD